MFSATPRHIRHYALSLCMLGVVFGLPSSAAAQGALDLPDFSKTVETAILPEAVDVEPPESGALSNPQENNTGAAAFDDSEVDENIFFDARALVPQSEIGRKSGPRKVNPRLQPGSKFVVVTKNHKASSRKAGIVAAERALKLGRYESALEMFDTLYQRNRRDVSVLLGRAVSLHRLGQEDLAIEAYEELLDLRPKNVTASVNMLGIIAQRYPEVALRRLKELRQDNRDDVGVIAQIAVVQAGLKQYNDAIRYLGIASSMEPENASHVFNMGVIADKAGSKPDAIKFYEQALEIDTLYGRGETIPRNSVFERLAELR